MNLPVFRHSIMLTLVALLATFLSIESVQSQNVEQCAAHLLHENLLQTDPGYASIIQANEAHIQSVVQNLGGGNGAQFSNNGVLEIPVVVHIIHSGQAVGVGANISDAQINSAMTQLNDRFRKTPGTHGDAAGVDVEIDFVLATRDPNCNATTGIVRVNGSSVTNYATEGISAGQGSGAVEQDIKNLSKWPNTDYMNVWVVSEIENNNGLFGIQGYAYFPGASSAVDGVVILHSAFGSLGTVNSFNNLGRTFTHEVGHYLNLYHTFEGDNSGASCPVAGNNCGSGSGDCCSDTEVHIRQASNCPTGTNNTCTGATYGLVLNNYMNYSSQACADMYTSAQKTRMRAALYTTRSGLLSSLGATPITTPAPVAAVCTPSTTNLSNGFNMGIHNVTFEDINVSSGNAVGDGGYVDHSCHQGTNVQPGTLYNISVFTGGTNNQDVEVYIDYNNDGDFTDAGENVLSSSNDTIHTGSLTTPASPATGSYVRMRVISDWSGNTISNSCYNSQYGQTEDYALLFPTVVTAPSVSITVNNHASCNGSSDGQATAVASGGTPGYSFSWSNGSAVALATGLAAATYTVTVTDNASNTATASVTIGQPTAVVVSSLTSIDESCNPGNDGQAAASASGGTPSYNYSWSNGAANSTIASLTAGDYTVTITDANGCTVTATETVDGCNNQTQLGTAYCGITLTSIGQSLYSDIITGAQNYRYRVIGPGVNEVYVKGSSSHLFKLSYLSSSVQIGSSYSVEVAVQLAGVWGGYGSACTVTTPSSVPTTQLGTAYCGITVTSLSQSLYPDIVPGAQDYRYRVIGSGVNEVYTKGSSSHLFKLHYLSSSFQVGSTYTVEVAANVAGTWGNYGTSCSVTTPSTVQVTQLAAAYCGITLTSFGQKLYCVAVPGAANYRYRVVGPGVNEVYVRGSASHLFKLTFLSASPQIGSSYSVEVAANVGGAWGNYSTACTITTPASVPSTQLAASYCGITLGSFGQKLFCVAIPGAQDYRYRVVGPGVNEVYTRGSSSHLFKLNYLSSALQVNSTYSVEVAANIAGTWGNYSTACNVTTPASKLGFFGVDDPVTELESDEQELRMNVYPNPSDGQFTLELETEKTDNLRVQLLTVTGQVLFSDTQDGFSGSYSQKLDVTGQASGIYFLRIQLGEEMTYRKLIVR